MKSELYRKNSGTHNEEVGPTSSFFRQFVTRIHQKAGIPGEAILAGSAASIRQAAESYCMVISY